jgi:hypothetical protein
MRGATIFVFIRPVAKFNYPVVAVVLISQNSATYARNLMEQLAAG